MRAPEVVVIGGSAGGMNALRGIFQTFRHPGNSSVFVILHRSPQESPLVQVLQTYTEIPIHEPDASPWTCPAGMVTVAPAGYHLLIGNTRTLVGEPPTPLTLYETGQGVRAHLTLDAPVVYSRPSLDVTFASTVELVNPVTVVLLSCANDDGAAGCEIVQAAGGRVILQDPASCEAPAAVKAAMRRVQPDHIADPRDIGKRLSEIVARNRLR